MGIFGKIGGFIYFSVLSLGCLKYPQEIRRADVGGMSLAYAVRGPESGRSVVLLHGNGGSHRSMLTQSKQLARAGYRVYSLDSRGQGLNPVLEEYHYADMMEDTYRFIRALGLDHPAVYGWSDGGIIALMLEIAHPGTCSLIALSGANLFPNCVEDWDSYEAWVRSEGTPLALMMLSEPDIKPEELSGIKCPALVTAGSKDIITVEHTRLIASHIPDAELVIVEGANHGNYIKKNPRMGRMLLDFMKRHDYGNN